MTSFIPVEAMKKIFSRKPAASDAGGALSGVNGSTSSAATIAGGTAAGGGGLAAGATAGSSSLLSASAGPWTVGRHHVTCEDIIAEGGFGVVFLVRQKDARSR